MKRFAIIANCQRRPIVQALKKNTDFSANFLEVMLPPVFQMEDKHFRHLENWLPKLDLIIYQPVESETFKTARSANIENVVPKAKRLKIPNLYFAGYHSGLVKFGVELNKFDEYKRHIEVCGVQHYKFLIHCFQKGLSVSETYSRLVNHELLSSDDIVNSCNESISVLRQREVMAGVDIPVSEAIAQNFKSTKLFHIHNHPSNHMLSIFLGSLFDKLGLKEKPLIEGPELLAHEYPPILPNVAQALDLGFSHTEGKFADEYVTTEEWVDNCFALYSKVPEYIKNFRAK
ncbi:hypothetical protein GTH32_10870 [Alteromonas sp. 345S023]|uniref:Polysaccharide biosynthesis enzyme WcbI domain-containing protein n=1 Tax=Alteromonas profundi TaxID=2696062 RepID=A0A7X5LLQ7_9ALTE|nr:WcbI family polysaccharide biosynthesis putative acetyltransferase [Alteromonas profundi]NDV91685.1 hypothetical protein [Alteromonas profundi]